MILLGPSIGNFAAANLFKKNFKNSIEASKAYFKELKKDKDYEDNLKQYPNFDATEKEEQFEEGKLPYDEYLLYLQNLNKTIDEYNEILPNKLKNNFLNTLDLDVSNVIRRYGGDPNTSFINLGYRFLRRKLPLLKNKENVANLNGAGTDIVSLNNSERIIDPDTKYKNILFNEFVETYNPSVYPAKKYKDGSITRIGDRRIPIGNINYWVGIEDGRYLLKRLDDFNDETIIYPARNIKSNILPISKLLIEDKDNFDIHKNSNIRRFGFLNDGALINKIIRNDESNSKLSDNILLQADSVALRYNQDLEQKLKALFGPEELIYYPINSFIPTDESNVELLSEIAKKYKDGHILLNNDLELTQYLNNIISKSNNLESVIHTHNNQLDLADTNKNTSRYYYIDTKGEKHPISDWNASILDNKMVLANDKDALFVGKVQDINLTQLDSINARAALNPYYLVLPDLGAFDTYRTDSTDMTQYLKLYFEHPDPKDPNLYVVGNNNPLLWRKLGGTLNYLNYFD